MRLVAVFLASLALSVGVGGQSPNYPSQIELKRTLINDDILQMVRAKVSDQTILAAVKAGPTRFDVSGLGIVRLKDAGVSEDIIRAMIAATTPSDPVQSPATIPPTPPPSSQSQSPKPDSVPASQAVHIEDLNQLLNRQVVVQRMPLCQPGSYNTVLAFSGKLAKVISIKPSALIPTLSDATLARMTPDARALVLDQQKAGTLLLEFADGTRLDSCAAVAPSRVNQYVELAAGETLAAPVAQPSTGDTRITTEEVRSSTRPANLLTEAEVQAAVRGVGKDHWVQILDFGLSAASSSFEGNPYIALYMPDAIVAEKALTAKKQFLTYQPSMEDQKRSLTVVAHGWVGETHQAGCVSVTRVVLLSDQAGGRVEEAYLSEAGTETWTNGYGANNECQWLRVKFTLAAMQAVRAAAKEGEFYVAVFAGTQNTKMYKVKRKFQAKLGLTDNKE